ncbi:MAG: DMT family transporter [Tissierellia bacterium]|nr:DMT family transporter [Tissierellia bacterium]
MDNRTKGILSLIASTASFACMGAMVKMTGGNIPLMEQVFFRNLVMVFIAAIWVKKHDALFFGHKGNRHLLLLRSTFGFLGVITTFYATNNLYLGDAQSLLKLSPFAVTIMAVIFLKEKITRIRVIALISAFVGALIIINPQFNSRLFPSLIAVAAAFCAGTAYVFVSYISRKPNKEAGFTIIFFFSAFSCIMSLPFMLYVFVKPTLLQLVQLLFIGIFAAMGQYFVTKAYSLTDASAISIFDYVGVIIATVLGRLVFGESLKTTSYIGMIIIIGSGLISYLDVKNMKRRDELS